MIVPDAERWRRLSLLFDELLDLEPGQRQALLDTLRAEDAALADELASLLADAERAEQAHFLDGTAAPPAATLADQRIGAYVLEAPIGQGGTGTVWRARRADGLFERAVAFKLLHPSLIGHIGALRFEREGKVLARLVHPNIARLLDAGVTLAGQPYLVLELVDGDRIDRHCDEAQLGIAERVALFRVVLDAVAHAHRHLVIHRDIKPGNILVDRQGNVKLLDFGIAKLLQAGEGGDAGELTVEGARVLTPDYAAPEQLRGELVSTATDVYALGVLLYELLAGRHPTVPRQASPVDALRATLEVDPDRLGTAVTVTGLGSAEMLERIAQARGTSPVRLRRQLAGDLENIVGKTLRKEPAARYPTVDALAEDLRRWKAGEPVMARPDSLAYRASRFVGRHRGGVAASAIALLAILAGVAGTISQARRAEQQSERATREAAQAKLERDRAVVDGQLQRGTNEFLQLVLRDSAGNDPGAVRRQLDRATELIARTKFEQPIVKVALLRQTAGRYAELGDIAAARRLLESAIDATAGTELALPTSGVPVNLACSHARYLHEMDEQLAAIAELDRADRLIAAGADVGVPSRVACMQSRVYAQSALGQRDRAVATARDALQQLEKAGIASGEQHRLMRSVLSQALMEAGRPAEAMAIARPLLAESTAAQGRTSIAVLRRSSVVTGLTRLGGDPLAALALSNADRDDAARVFGPGHEDAALALEHGRILLALGRGAEAAPMLARATAESRRSGRIAFTLAAGIAEIDARLEAGDVRGAASTWSELAPLRAKAVAEGRPSAIDLLLLESRLAATRGDARAVLAPLEAAQKRVEADGGVANPMAFDVALARAEAMLAAGEPAAAALPVAEQALGAARATSLDPQRSSLVGQALLVRARILERAGRVDDMRRDAAEAARQLAPTLGDGHPATRAASRLAAIA
ncbi:serine/threonine-protein kinase [Scleromatobacter humisilvae]|uniref:Protein kinase n=1 Tax=Scleromatobacter humisilvae TaxID=2897159 RepID=A0A9X1YFJ9_9BURK|nr:serine/threonine-protein kinase [Scleromatobacter humisilvae]MCK9685454.1 protein kinase [Scleromatobacter humisilvae]